MSDLSILIHPDQRLRRQSVPVEKIDDSTLSFIGDLEAVMRSGPGAVGIAAPQVGTLLQIVIVDVSGRPKTPNNGRMILINPQIQSWEGLETGREGCLSVPDYTGNVIRAKKVILSAMDESARLREYECSGYEARAVQHEIDHLNGLLFLDRIVSTRSDLFARKVYQPSQQQKESSLQLRK